MDSRQQPHIIRPKKRWNHIDYMVLIAQLLFSYSFRIFLPFLWMLKNLNFRFCGEAGRTIASNLQTMAGVIDFLRGHF